MGVGRFPPSRAQPTCVAPAALVLALRIASGGPCAGPVSTALRVQPISHAICRRKSALHRRATFALASSVHVMPPLPSPEFRARPRNDDVHACGAAQLARVEPADLGVVLERHAVAAVENGLHDVVESGFLAGWMSPADIAAAARGGGGRRRRALSAVTGRTVERRGALESLLPRRRQTSCEAVLRPRRGGHCYRPRARGRPFPRGGPGMVNDRLFASPELNWIAADVGRYDLHPPRQTSRFTAVGEQARWYRPSPTKAGRPTISVNRAMVRPR